ncbi:MAG: amidohydrolase [Spirochaetia bacterium]|nr:amidohydrolase [Spirochaetia bacterium]
MIQGIPVFDLHCHFPVAGDYFPDYPKFGKVDFGKARIEGFEARNYGEVWRKAYNFPKPEPSVEDDAVMADKWIKDIDAKQIEKIGWTSGGGNDRLEKICKMYPDRFYGFAHHHPDSENAVEVLEKAFKEQNMIAYKILGPMVPTDLSDKKYYPLWEVCQKYDKPVLIHFGLLGAAGGTPAGINLSPYAIADVSKKFPHVKFIVPHFGCTYMEDLLQLMWTRDNIWVDTSGSNQWIRWMSYRLSLEDVQRKFVETVGPSRIIFSTDSSWMPRGFAYIYLEEQHKNFRFLNLNDNELHMIFHKNAEYLTGLI